MVLNLSLRLKLVMFETGWELARTGSSSTKPSPAPGYDAMYDLALRGYDALHAVHGEYYEVGCIPCVLYTAAGTSLDWALGVAHIPYVYSIELRDTGLYGFILPPEQIIPTAEEAWAFHKVAAEQMIAEFGSK